ncbi:MAG: poly-beta-1,6-N-acetyl-D-glucosamine biosynthesis protein PgaD [Pseudomonadota bacterium]
MAEELGDIIINARNVLGRRVRNRDRLLTTIMWGLYAYLWLPLVSLGAWYLGMQFAYDLVLRAGGPDSLWSLLFWFTVILLTTALVVIVWSWVQRARFADNERRVSSPVIGAEEEMAFWDIDKDTLAHYKSERRLVVRFNEEGRLEEATPDRA